LAIQIKNARAANPYVWLKNQGIDCSFWSLFHYDFYNLVAYVKDKNIVLVKYIYWWHIESMDTSMSRRVI
jgi:hypothetical protein